MSESEYCGECEAEAKRLKRLLIKVEGHRDKYKVEAHQLTEERDAAVAEVEHYKKLAYDNAQDWGKTVAEVERLRADLKYRTDQYDGLAIRFDRIEEAARDLLANGLLRHQDTAALRAALGES